MINYWKNGPDTEINTSKNILKYYLKAGKLQVTKLEYMYKSVNQKHGKTVVLNIDVLLETLESIQLFKKILRGTK